MAMSSDIAGALDRLQARIEQACERAGRDPGSVQLVAVSKGHPEEAIRAAYEAGMRVFGENYAQELGVKASALSDLRDISWRFIGHLQRNKIKLIEGARATVDTVDSVRLAEAISTRAAARATDVEVLLQVNVGGEAQKSGCTPDEVPALVGPASRRCRSDAAVLRRAPRAGRGARLARAFYGNDARPRPSRRRRRDDAPNRDSDFWAASSGRALVRALIGYLAKLDGTTGGGAHGA
jgi:hypothetical protein